MQSLENCYNCKLYQKLDILLKCQFPILHRFPSWFWCCFLHVIYFSLGQSCHSILIRHFTFHCQGIYFGIFNLRESSSVVAAMNISIFGLVHLET